MVSDDFQALPVYFGQEVFQATREPASPRKLYLRQVHSQVLLLRDLPIDGTSRPRLQDGRLFLREGMNFQLNAQRAGPPVLRALIFKI